MPWIGRQVGQPPGHSCQRHQAWVRVMFRHTILVAPTARTGVGPRTGSRTTALTQRHMTDTVDPATRSEIMSRIRGRDTEPEMIVRRIAHGLGFRFRLHRRDLPGSPDLVFPRYRAAIMVHGCFWHRHPGCKYASSPKTRVRFWEDKFEGNVVRDRRNEDSLHELGWRVMVIWECETRDREAVAERISEYLGKTTSLPTESEHDTDPRHLLRGWW